MAHECPSCWERRRSSESTAPRPGGGRRHCSSAHSPVGYFSPARGATKGGLGVRRLGRWRTIVLPRRLAVLAVVAGAGGLAALLATAAWRLGRARPPEVTLPGAPPSVHGG